MSCEWDRVLLFCVMTVATEKPVGQVMTWAVVGTRLGLIETARELYTGKQCTEKASNN